MAHAKFKKEEKSYLVKCVKGMHEALVFLS